VICLLLQVYSYLLVVRLLLSWFPDVPEALRPVVSFLSAITDPVLRLVRPLVPPLRLGMMALDLSPLLVFAAIYILIAVLSGAGVC
jgi:YggT family protein